MSIAHDAELLRTDIAEIRSAMAGGVHLYASHLAGKLHDLLNKTEVAVRKAFRDYLKQSGVDYDVSLRSAIGQGKPLDRLTFGQVLGCLRQVNQRLKVEEFQALDLINDFVKGHHSHGQEQDLVSNAGKLLDAIDVLTRSALMHK